MSKELNYDNYEEELAIDPVNLDLEWLNQPNLFSKYSMLAAKAAKELTEAKEDIKLVEAECRLDILKSPEEYLRGAKATVDNISAAVLTHSAYQSAANTKIQAEYSNDVARTALFAFQQRKDALENLVRLAGMEYFAMPDTKRNLNREFNSDAVKKDAVEKVKAAKRRV